MYSHPGRAFVFWHAPEGRALRSDMLSVGRAFKLRLAIRRSGLYGPTTILSRSDIFKRRWRSKDVGPEGADLQKSAGHRGGATCSRRSGLYGPTTILSRSDIFKRRWRSKDVGPEGADLQKSADHHGGATCSRRSGLYGPTTILSRSDIFTRRWRSKDVGPEGSDLQKSADHRGSATCPRRSGLYGPTTILSRSDIFTRQWSTTSDLKAPTYKTPVRRRLKIRHLPVEKFAAKAIGAWSPYAACGIKNSRLMRPPSTLTRSRNCVR